MINISKPITIGLFSGLLVSCLTGCFRLLEIDANSYQNYEEVVADGAIQRGWIPDYLPVSAVNIYEKHDLDTNETIVKFWISTNEIKSLIRNCQKVDTFSTPKILTAKWWSNELISSAETHFYCNEDKAYMVVDNKTVYYWRTY